jgi:hypothetical protein
MDCVPPSGGAAGVEKERFALLLYKEYCRSDERINPLNRFVRSPCRAPYFRVMRVVASCLSSIKKYGARQGDLTNRFRELIRSSLRQYCALLLYPCGPATRRNAIRVSCESSDLEVTT